MTTASTTAPRHRLPRLAARDVGPVTVLGLVAAAAAVWFVARPASEPIRTHVGQLFGLESVLLMSIALVLISTLPWVEEWFDGIDRAAIWHRRAAITGLVLLAPHLLLSSAEQDGGGGGGSLAVIGTLGLLGLAVWAVLPRWRALAPEPLRDAVLTLRDLPLLREARRIFGGYERWRAIHRTTGLFVAAGFVHGLLDGTSFDRTAVLRWLYVAIGGVGLGFYVYRETLARFFLPLHDYEVDGVRVIEDDLVEVALRPVGRPIAFTPGQFAMVFLEAKDGWHRHPFTIASAPGERVVRVTVKALGDYTSQFHEYLEPGMPAVIGGPHGRFDRRNGSDRQVWIGAGVGVAPFLSWVRALDGDLEHAVDFFVTNDGPGPFTSEIAGIAARHPSLRFHVVNTSVEGRLTPERVLATVDASPRELSVYMCGPQGMLRAFQTAFRRAGVARTRIHREYFDWR